MDGEENALTIECGFCLRKNLDIRESRLMPCSHVHCLMCLKLFFDANHQVVCPVENCRKVCETPIADLPVHEITEDTSRCCDVCLKKKKRTIDAIIYCFDCSRKFCSSHLELHEELHYDHSNITVREYLETRMCKQHKSCPYILGCKHCYSVVCVKCMADPSPCSKGKKEPYHELIELNKLVEILVDKDMKTQIMEREEELQNIFKEASNAQAYFDRKTAELIELLRKRRDEQVKAITADYAQLEVELLECRQEDKVHLTEFIDEEVLGIWSKLRNYQLKIESQAAHIHQADIIQDYQQIFDEMENMLNEKLPTVELPELVELRILGENRKAELSLMSSGQLTVNIKEGAYIKPAIAAPISLTEFRPPSSRQGDRLITLFGDLYLTSTSSLNLFTKYPFKGPYIKIVIEASNIIDIASNIDELFILSFSSVYVYDSRFVQVRKWDLEPLQQVQQTSTHDTYPTSLAVVANQLLFTYTRETKMSIYTLTGEFVRFVCLPEKLTSYPTPPALVHIEDTSVLCLSPKYPAATHQTVVLARLDINTGLSVWASEKQGFTAIACYKDQYLFLASLNMITILDIQTGTEIRSLTIPANYYRSRRQMYPVMVNCISVTGDTLVVLTSSKSDDNPYCSRFYEMEFELLKITG